MPAELTEIDLVVKPFDQRKPPVVAEHVRVIAWPDVIIFDPLVIMTGTGGGVQPFAVTITSFEIAVQPFAPVTVTL